MYIKIPNLTRKNIKNFYKKTWKNISGFGDCWIWMGANDGISGYGKFGIGGRMFGAHRVSYFLHTGDDPGEKFICHHCDEPRCVNPSHLFIGTPRENKLDSIKKGRHGYNPYRDGKNMLTSMPIEEQLDKQELERMMKLKKNKNDA